jgi:hypothetical protein
MAYNKQVLFSFLEAGRCMGVQKSNKKGMAPYQKDEQKQHKKKAGETNLLLNGRNMVGFLDKTVVSRVRMSS